VNNYASQYVVYGRAFMETVIAAFKTVPGGALVVTGKVRLSTDPSFNPTPLSKISDLTPNEANYSGYASGGIAAVLSAPVILSPAAVATVISAFFLATTGSPFVPNNTYGYWIDDGTNVIAAERFANAGVAGFGEAGDFLALTVLLPMQLAQATV
jgi:hypothetical protein